MSKGALFPRSESPEGKAKVTKAYFVTSLDNRAVCETSGGVFYGNETIG